MPTDDSKLISDMGDLVLDRLEAWRGGDQQRVAELDARAPKEGPGLTALWSAAFGIAERTLNVLAAHDPREAETVLRSIASRLSSTGASSKSRLGWRAA